MAKTSLYLNFPGTTEAAFNFYRQVFGTEFSRPLVRMGDIPQAPGQPPMPDDEKSKVMNIGLPILGGLELMATDAVGERGKLFKAGNNVSISLHPDTRAEARRLFAELSANGSEVFPLTEMFWGALWSSFVDQYGTRWMINCEAKE